MVDEKKESAQETPTEETSTAADLAANLTLGGASLGGSPGGGNEDNASDSSAAVEGEAEVEVQIDPTGRLVEPGTRKYHWGTGRRKTAVARVRIRPGDGQFVVNDRPMKEFFCRSVDHESVTGPLACLQVEGKVDVFVKVHGGGITGQAGAVRLGMGRALVGLYPDAYQALREKGHLTRDPRMVERKKYGLRGARRAFQWVKR
ncbi:MAG: 30S ribosomal protein S9 [Planctomycetota bacterium]|nr:MAG: 30S ribosomal protein S9 [Planctomycetota bacterium]